ncbi:uncharacterized protein [Zea mays]|nr:uncharacterized protein LOC103632672 [Zea mays]|eukprot:XP_008652644.2 uncharacterized protein LOC103632672 [Zea mays]
MEATMQDILDALARMEARLTDALVGRCGEQYAREHTSPFDGSMPPSSIVNTQYRDEAILPPLVHDDAAKVASLDSGNDFGLQQTATVLASLGSDEMSSSTTLLAGSISDRYIPPLYDDDCYTMPQPFVDTLANPDDDLLQELDVLDEDAASANAADDDSGAVLVYAPLDSNIDSSGSPRYPCLPEGAVLFHRDPHEKVLIGGTELSGEVRRLRFSLSSPDQAMNPALVPNTDAEEEEVLTITPTKCSTIYLNRGIYSVPNPVLHRQHLLRDCDGNHVGVDVDILPTSEFDEGPIFDEEPCFHRSLLDSDPDSPYDWAVPVIAVHGSGDTELSHSEADKVPATAALPNLREKICCRFVDRTKLSRHVHLIHFSLPSPDQVLGIPTGTHVFDCTSVDGKPCMRSYTPPSKEDEVLATTPNRCLMNCFILTQSCFSPPVSCSWDAVMQRQPWPPPMQSNRVVSITDRHTEEASPVRKLVAEIIGVLGSKHMRTVTPLPDTGQWLLLSLIEKLPQSVVDLLRAHVINLHHYLMLFSLLGFSVLFDCIKAPDSNAICRGITQDMTYAAVQAYTDAYKPDWERINFIVDILRSTPGEGPSWYHLLKKVSGGCNDLKNNEHMLVVVLTKQQAIKTGDNFQIVEYFLVEAIQIQSYGAEGNTELNLSTGDYIVVGVSDVQVWCGCDLLFRITDWHIPWHIILAVSKISIGLGASRSSRMEKCQPYVQSSVTSRDKQKLFVRFFGVLYRVFNKMNFMLLLDDDWEPLMDNYRPLGIKSLRFNTFSLGNMSPKIEEQKIQYTIHTIGGSLTAVHGFFVQLGVNVDTSDWELQALGRLSVTVAKQAKLDRFPITISDPISATFGEPFEKANPSHSSTAIVCRAGSGIDMVVGLVSSSLGAVASGQGNFKVLVWDPGGYAYHSLGTSCISSGGECQHLRQEQ